MRRLTRIGFTPGHRRPAAPPGRPWHLALLLLVLAPRPAPAAERNLLAHAGGDALWVAAVVPRPPEPVVINPMGTSVPPATGPSQQTQIWARPNRPKQPWRVLAVIPGRVTSLAARDSQLAVLMADGTWLSVFADGSASGQPLPAGGRLVTLGDDGQALWAVGRVAGGLAAAEADLARQAAATRASTTAPTTVAVSKEPDRLVVFHQDQGRWATAGELPAEIPPATDDLSLVVIGRLPAVAYRRADGSVHTVRGRADGRGWESLDRPTAEPGGKPPAAFQLLADAATAGPVLWTTDGPADPGQVRVEAAGGSGTTAAEAAVRKLAWAGPPPLAGTPAAALAGGYLRVVGPAAGPGVNAVEQRYELSGAPVGSPAAVYVPPELGDSAVLSWLQGLLLASLMFTVGTSFYRQFTPGGRAVAGAGAVRGAMAADVASVVPAPLSARALAGGIDLLPLVVAGLAAAVTAAGHPAEESLSTATVLLVLIGAAVYLAHTTVLEAMTARSAGKWITGLRVATPDGSRPATWQLVSRNLLRVLDPLIWIALSPLRQRTADVLAGTVVVREGGPASDSSSESEPEPGSPPEAGA